METRTDVRRASLADIDELNALLNDPSIRPTIGGEGELDASDLVADARNVVLFNRDGGAIFRWTGPRVFEGHSFFRVRGREAIALGKHILSLLDCDLVWGLTPIGNRPARWFNRQVGFVSLGEMHAPDGVCELFEQRK